MGYYMVKAASISGMGVDFVRVEADISNGLPFFHLVGYLSSEVKEAAERVKTAIRNIGVQLPAKKITVNLSPAWVRKKGTMFDLPIAVSVLAAMQEIPVRRLEHTLFVGELGLDGKIQGVEGILPIVMEAKEQGVEICIIPEENLKEGELVYGVQVVGVKNLKEVCDWISGKQTRIEKSSIHTKDWANERKRTDINYTDIRGQEIVKRATLVAVAGNHNLLYIGPPGAGKTMLAKRIPTILPALTKEECLEITKIYSYAGRIKKENPLIVERPFREVHQTATRTALTGGGRIPGPGEATLAHKGVLFLDELTEFPRGVLEVLRQPLEEKKVRLVRQYGAYEFPADFMLVAAMNPCPCGNYPDVNKCSCTSSQIQNYLGKVSQPFLDRMDICVEVPKVEYDSLITRTAGDSSEKMREQVEKARVIQKERYTQNGISTNAQMTKEQIEKFCNLTTAEEGMMKQAYEVFHLTARSYFKILKVARTIADLEGEERIREEHLKEAISYRMIDKKYWGN